MNFIALMKDLIHRLHQFYSCVREMSELFIKKITILNMIFCSKVTVNSKIYTSNLSIILIFGIRLMQQTLDYKMEYKVYCGVSKFRRSQDKIHCVVSLHK